MRTAVDLVLDEHAIADEEDQQLGLFAEPATEAGRRRQAGRLERRGPGRPPGARNRRTEATVAFLLARHRDPRAVLLEIAEANVADLAALYGCTLFEAGQEKRLAAAAVLPYTAARMPLAIDVSRRSAVYLTIVDGAVEARDEAGTGVVAGILESVEYQDVSETPPAPVGQSAVGQRAIVEAAQALDPSASVDPGSAGDAPELGRE